MPKQACMKFTEPAVKSIKDGLSACMVAPAMLEVQREIPLGADDGLRPQGVYGYC
jgi:hypothetical protein